MHFCYFMTEMYCEGNFPPPDPQFVVAHGSDVLWPIIPKMGHSSPKAEMTEWSLEALGVLSHQKPGGYMVIRSQWVNAR